MSRTCCHDRCYGCANRGCHTHFLLKSLMQLAKRPLQFRILRRVVQRAESFGTWSCWARQFIFSPLFLSLCTTSCSC
uniref:Uncharacterized protein n=1 Tax=Arundo donax TaxID=35708 RepID=A0A0A9A6Z1_ARUDO